MPNENNKNKTIEREKIMLANDILAEQIEEKLSIIKSYFDLYKTGKFKYDLVKTKEYVEKVRKLIEAMEVLH